MADLWKGKKWYTISTPKLFGGKVIAEIPAGDPKTIVGRTLTAFLSDLTGDPSKYFYKQWADLYQENNQFIYVNRGFGFIGYPGRVGILPEVTIFELKSA